MVDLPGTGGEPEGILIKVVTQRSPGSKSPAGGAVRMIPVLLTVKDDGDPRLTRYGRVLIVVDRREEAEMMPAQQTGNDAALAGGGFRSRADRVCSRAGGEGPPSPA